MLYFLLGFEKKIKLPLRRDKRKQNLNLDESKQHSNKYIAITTQSTL